jgi:hypothetical protein
MPIPSFVVSVSLTVCEKVLIEQDDVISAIRIVNLFTLSAPVPPLPEGFKTGDPLPAKFPVITAWVVANISANFGYDAEHLFELKIKNTRNELTPLMNPIRQRFQNRTPDAPPEIGLITQIGLMVVSLGICYICLYLDGEEIARTPITLALAKQGI